MGTVHADRWSRLPEARVVAAVDIRAERAQTLARVHGLEGHYTDYRPAVERRDVDVVSVCVPTCSHPEIAVHAARAGKHVLCEKPIALSLGEAEAMIAACRQNGVKLGVGFMRRHSPLLTPLRDWLAAGQLRSTGVVPVGRPVMYHATDVRELRPKREMHDAQANGGPIIDMGVHLFDLWSFLFDAQPVAVFAQGLTLAARRPELAQIRRLAYDTATIVVRYTSGDVGTFALSWGLPPGVTPAGRPDQIMGPEGLAHLTFGVAHQQVEIMQAGGRWSTLFASEDDMYQRQIARFARHVIDDAPFAARGETGLAALRVALAALESVQTGQPVLMAAEQSHA
jgi:predicted dehydrogenase